MEDVLCTIILLFSVVIDDLTSILTPYFEARNGQRTMPYSESTNTFELFTSQPFHSNELLLCIIYDTAPVHLKLFRVGPVVIDSQEDRTRRLFIWNPLGEWSRIIFFSPWQRQSH